LMQAIVNKAPGTAPPESPYSRRVCPGCAADLPSPAPEVVSSPPAESLTFEELKRGWHGFFRAKSFFSYHRCRNCGLLYCLEFFGPAQLDELYRQMPDNTAGVPVDLLRKTQRGYFNILKKHSSLTGEYMEVGPDIGLFTENCVREGRFGRYWLFEPNRAVLPALKALLEGKSYEIRPEFLNIGVLPENRLSTVVMVHVLDHVVDPKGMLVELRKTLAQGAVVMFVTHDESSLLARLIGVRWPPYCLQHPLLFRPATIARLLESAGYRVLEIEKTQNHFPLLYLIKHFAWAAGLKRIPFPDWNAPAVPIKLGNILTIAAPRS
jgi:hypothetical protein